MCYKNIKLGRLFKLYNYYIITIIVEILIIPRMNKPYTISKKSNKCTPRFEFNSKRSNIIIFPLETRIPYILNIAK